MTPRQIQLMMDIIDCPNRAKELSGPCSKVLSIQSGMEFRQVPEPWNGDIDNASVMFIGSNPALAPHEVFPSKDMFWGQWVSKGPKGSSVWTDSEAMEFFEGRFGKALCPDTGTPYVQFAGLKPSVLSFDLNKFYPKPAQNGYWAYYARCCKALDSSFDENTYNFVVTDFVHCKGPGNIGFTDALPVCQLHTGAIIDAFLSNNAATHTIILIGGRGQIAKELKTVNNLGFSEVGKKSIGSYDRKMNGNKTLHHIDELIMQNSKGQKFKLICPLPSPSGQNAADTNVILNGVRVLR